MVDSGDCRESACVENLPWVCSLTVQRLQHCKGERESSVRVVSSVRACKV